MRRRFRPVFEALETRCLLSTVAGMAEGWCTADALPAGEAPAPLILPGPPVTGPVVQGDPLPEVGQIDLQSAGVFFPDSRQSGILRTLDGSEQRYVEVEVIQDPNGKVCYPEGVRPPVLSVEGGELSDEGCLSTLIGWLPPAGKVGIGSYRIDEVTHEDGRVSFHERVLFGLSVSHHPDRPLDTNDSGEVTVADALQVINFLNRSFETASNQPVESPPKLFLDTSGDGQVSPIDALLIINFLENRLRS